MVSQFLHDGNYSAAARMLERVTEDDPDNANAQKALGYVYQMNHENQKAIAAYQKALALNPGDADSRTALQELQQK